jgi:hypothetical protein
MADIDPLQLEIGAALAPFLSYELLQQDVIPREPGDDLSLRWSEKRLSDAAWAAIKPIMERATLRTASAPAYVGALRRMWRNVRRYDPDAIARAGYRDAIRDLAHELGVDLDG